MPVIDLSYLKVPTAKEVAILRRPNAHNTHTPIFRLCVRRRWLMYEQWYWKRTKEGIDALEWYAMHEQREYTRRSQRNRRIITVCVIATLLVLSFVVYWTVIR